MEQAAAIIGISGIIILLINIANQKKSHFGSDHFFHLNLIRLIKNNGHRFVTRYKNFIGNECVAYPQLFHWLFSFFSMKNPIRLNFLFKSAIVFLDVSFFLIFFYSGFLQFTSELSLFSVFLFAALLFIFTPFNFVRWNATNAGFSPRSWGLLLGRIFIYLFLFYLYHVSFVYLGLLMLVSYFIFISSQFAAQYMIFFCLIYALFALNIFVAAIPFAGFALFYIFHPAIAVNYIKGQYQHKKMYALHLASQGLLKYRPGIWRDFVYDFWVKLKAEKLKALPYIQSNAVVSLFWGFTILPVVVYYLVNETILHHNWNFVKVISASPLFQVVLITLLIFFITSFRKTRFLGEPERYLEFANPAMVFLLIQTCGSNIVYGIIVYYVTASVLLIVISKAFDKNSDAIKSNMLLALDEKQAAGKSLKDVIGELKEMHGTVRLFSNNEEVTRRLLSEDFVFLIPDITSEKTGPFYYKDIYNEFHPKVNEALLLPVIEEFDINVFIADTRYLSKPYTELFQSFNIETCFILNYFVLIYLHKKKSA